MSVITHLLQHWYYGNFSLSKLACFKITSVTLFALLVFCCFMFRQRGNRRNERTPVFWPTPSKWTADFTAALPACPEGAISNRFMTRCENDRRLSEFIIEQISGLFFKTVWTLRILERLIGGREGEPIKRMAARAVHHISLRRFGHMCAKRTEDGQNLNDPY